MVDFVIIDENRCWVDGRANVSDRHHIIPVEYDGPENGKKVPLCPTCHRSVHKEGEHLYKTGQSGKFINPETYPHPEHRARITLLARYICEAKKRFEASGKLKADESRNIIQVGMTPDELAMAHALKNSLGFKSLPRMVKSLIFEKYNAIRK